MGAGRGQAGTNMNISSLIYEKAETLAEPAGPPHFLWMRAIRTGFLYTLDASEFTLILVLVAYVDNTK